MKTCHLHTPPSSSKVFIYILTIPQ